MKYGIVTTNVLDMWSRPQFESERFNQALWGSLVRIGGHRFGYARVVLSDGYVGWVSVAHVREIDRNVWETYYRSRNAVVTTRTARLIDPDSGKVVDPFFLYYGTELCVDGTVGNKTRIVLPDGKIRLIAANAITRTNVISQKVTGPKLVAEAKKFLGVQYLWGGITPAGFDCSGLVSAICRRFGVGCPRDTKDQIKIGKKIMRKQIRTGDLLFFERHVGIAIGRNRLIHSSVGGSGVRVNSLKPKLPDYREDLDKTFDQARRIL